MQELLTLFQSLTRHLETLTELARQKTLAVRKSDLNDLDRILKEEQAQALALRGLEQKRVTLLKKLSLEKTPLIDLPAKAPPALQQEMRDCVDTLRQTYRVYNSAADIARSTLECNLHEIERILAAAGAQERAEHLDDNIEPPSPMKADFRV